MHYWKTHFKRAGIIIQAAAVLLVLLLIVCNIGVFFADTNSTVSYVPDNYSNAITKAKPLTAVFVPSHSSLRYLEFSVVTPETFSAESTLTFTATAANGKVMAEKNILVADIPKNGAVRLAFSHAVKRGAAYTVTISGTAQTDETACRISIGSAAGQDIVSWQHYGIQETYALGVACIYRAPVKARIVLAALALLLCLGAVLLPPLKKQWLRIAYCAALALALPVLSLSTIETLNFSTMFALPVHIFILNCALIFALELLLFALSGRICGSLLAANVLAVAAGFANYLALQFRGLAITPPDIFAWNTALDVVSAYSLSITPPTGFTGIALAVICCLCLRENLCWNRLRWRLIGSAACLLLSGGILFLLCSRDAATRFNVATDQFQQTVNCKSNGFLLNFAVNLSTLWAEKPDGYNVDTLQELAAEYADEKKTPAVQPNIVVIMNESLADLSMLGDTMATEDVLPFIHSLAAANAANTRVAQVVVPVFGGGTSGTEFEALTGYSLYTVSASISPYVTDVTSSTNSLASHLREVGYSTTAMHPEDERNWSRRRAYPLLGFEQSIFANSGAFAGQSTFNGRTTDAGNYAVLQQTFADSVQNGPVFLFNVTMQNHGAYDHVYSETETAPRMLEMAKEAAAYPLAQQYLSLIRESDAAFGDLIAYFETVEEPTIVVMFGDHLPCVEDEYYATISGRSYEELRADKDAVMFTTPIIFWANYDVDFSFIPDKFSANYISPIILKAAGLPFTPFENFLYKGIRLLPVNSSVNGNIFEQAMESADISAFLDEYQCLQYNALFDDWHHATAWHTVPQ